MIEMEERTARLLAMPAADSRTSRYWALASEKRRQALQQERQDYYANLLKVSSTREDPASEKDRKQLNKDLPRTFHSLPDASGPGGKTSLLPLLWNILVAYIERGRAMSATSLKRVGLEVGAAAEGAATTARGLLNGYPQGLNFFAGMSLLCAGGARWDGEHEASLEETAFWLLAFLLEDVLDPDFFGADVRGNLQMAYIGGLGMRTMVVELAEVRCPAMFKALGPEAFGSSLGAVLDQWVLSVFVGCVPSRVLDKLWDKLMLASPERPDMTPTRSRPLPQGVGTIISFALAALQLCGERELEGSQALDHLANQQQVGATPEMLSLEAAEAMQGVRSRLATLSPSKDDELFERMASVQRELTASNRDSAGLWDEVRKRKQRIADCAEKCDEQLMSLANRTHFTVSEIQRLKDELELMKQARSGPGLFVDGLSLEAFVEVVSRVVPEFPRELCGRLFQKLDAFGVGRLAFAELACGMSALSLGTMDEKLQVCFDLFDSEGQRALSLKDLGELCAVLFRVALAQGHEWTQQASTDEVLLKFRPMSWDDDEADEDADEAVIPESSSFDQPAPSGLEPAGRVRVPRPRPRLDPPRCANRVHRMRHSLPASPAFWNKESMQGRKEDKQPDPPWRSMLLRLLSAAQVRTPGGPWLVAFEDFRGAARMEPALLCLFSWCLPRPPDSSTPAFSLTDDEDRRHCGPPQRFCSRACRWLQRVLGRVDFGGVRGVARSEGS